MISGEALWWLVIVTLFGLSLLGLIYPVLPSILLVWLGFAVYHFALEPIGSTWFWVMMLLFTLLVFVADYAAHLYFVSRSGGSRLAQWAALGGLVIGPFIMGPAGLLVGPFAAVLAVELFRQKDPLLAAKVAAGALLGFLSSTVIKLVIQGVMIAWFLWIVL